MELNISDKNFSLTKGTGDVKTWGHIGVKNDLKFIHDIWNFARMRILDQSNFPIHFKSVVCLSVHTICSSVLIKTNSHYMLYLACYSD